MAIGQACSHGCVGFLLGMVHTAIATTLRSGIINSRLFQTFLHVTAAQRTHVRSTDYIIECGSPAGTVFRCTAGLSERPPHGPRLVRSSDVTSNKQCRKWYQLELPPRLITRQHGLQPLFLKASPNPNSLLSKTERPILSCVQTLYRSI